MKNGLDRIKLFAIIEKEGLYDFPSFALEIKKQALPEKTSCSAEFLVGSGDERDCVLLLEGCRLPFCVRSRQAGDEIETSDGNFKSVNDVFSSWAVPEELRDFIPLVQEFDEKESGIKCICGSVCGFKNWIVKK